MNISGKKEDIIDKWTLETIIELQKIEPDKLTITIDFLNLLVPAKYEAFPSSDEENSNLRKVPIEQVSK